MNATRKHSRTEMTRLSCWLMIKNDQLRILPERAELQDLMNKPEEARTVINHRISFEGKEFNIKHANIPHSSKVKVIKNIWKWKEGIVTVSFENKLYEATCIEKLAPELGGFSTNAAIIGQQYKSQPETKTQKAKKRLDELATGSSVPGKDALPFTGLNALEGFREKAGNLYVLPKKGTPLPISRLNVSRKISITKFIKDLCTEIGMVSPELNQRLKKDFGATIDMETAEAIKAQIVECGNYDLEPVTRHLNML